MIFMIKIMNKNKRVLCPLIRDICWNNKNKMIEDKKISTNFSLIRAMNRALIENRIMGMTNTWIMLNLLIRLKVNRRVRMKVIRLLYLSLQIWHTHLVMKSYLSENKIKIGKKGCIFRDKVVKLNKEREKLTMMQMKIPCHLFADTCPRQSKSNYKRITKVWRIWKIKTLRLINGKKIIRI